MNGFDKDFYKALGVAENASAAEIKRAYRKLAQKYHPDRNPGNKAAEETMKTASEAYDVLSDEAKRKEYDNVRKMSRSGGFRVPSGGGAGGFNVGAEGFDVSDLLGSLFGGKGRGRRGGSARAAAKGPDLETHVELSFDEALRGTTIAVQVERDVACESCNGTGAQPGSKVSVCGRCNGSGMVGDDQGFFSFQRPCDSCHGSGRKIEKPCHSCDGAGVIRRAQEVKVRIPAGVNDGSRIRARGQGGPGPRGGEPGDLYVSVHVLGHPLFGRSGSDLTLDLPLTYAEATLGSEVSVPTLDGSVKLKVAPGTQPGRTFRVKGRGFPKAKGGSGDLLATVRVVIPEQISQEERKILESLRSEQNGSVRQPFGMKD
ncbi:MAG: molecular chaperone DnaJ [Actinomycetota bacterium]